MTYRNVKFFEKYTILATDGDIGTIHDFLFDDITWTIRYLVVDTGKWLPGRKVLISTKAVEEALWDRQQFQVNLTKEQIENSPDINTEAPVSLQNEIALNDYYSWSYYWTPTGLIPIHPMSGVAPLTTPLNIHKPDSQSAESTGPEGTPHLRSTNEVIGYHIGAADGDIGHVEDFLANDESWELHYMVVDTKNWLPGRKVLVSPEWITEVTWNTRKVVVKMTRNAVENSPEYDPETPMTPESENDLLEHYNVQKIRPGLAAHLFTSQQRGPFQG
jgi:hypothetical protein